MERRFESRSYQDKLFLNLISIIKENHLQLVKLIYIQIFFCNNLFLCIVLIVVGPKDTLPEDVVEVTFDEYEKYLPFIYESVRKNLNISP